MMFNDIGDMIKKIAIILSFLFALGFLLVGFFISLRYDEPIICIAAIFGGPFVSIIYGVFTYGFGVLVENSEFILKSVRSIEKKLSDKIDNKSDTNNTVSKA